MPAKLQIQWLDISEIAPYPDNPRKRTEVEVEKIAASLMEFGWRQPLVVDSHRVLIVGHGRRLAALALIQRGDPAYAERYGTKVPVDVADDLSEEQVRAYRIADNRIQADSSWDDGLLVKELADLRDLDYDLALTGFDSPELASLLGLVQPGDMPDLPSGEKEPYQQMTFTLHDEQVVTVEQAVALAKEQGPFTDGLNQNSNGNALARVCKAYLKAFNQERQHAREETVAS